MLDHRGPRTGLMRDNKLGISPPPARTVAIICTAFAIAGEKTHITESALGIMDHCFRTREIDPRRGGVLLSLSQCQLYVH